MRRLSWDYALHKVTNHEVEMKYNDEDNFALKKDNFTMTNNIQENIKDVDNWRDKSTDENG